MGKTLEPTGKALGSDGAGSLATPGKRRESKGEFDNSTAIAFPTSNRVRPDPNHCRQRRRCEGIAGVASATLFTTPIVFIDMDKLGQALPARSRAKPSRLAGAMRTG